MAIKEIKREWSPEQLGYVKEFLLHSEKDVKNLPSCCIGSKAKVSETGNVYVCSASGEWAVKGAEGVAAGCASAANKVYVTDSSGVPGWDDRTHYDAKEYSFAYGTKLPTPKITTYVKIVQGGSSSQSYRVGKLSDVTPAQEEIMFNCMIGDRTSKAEVLEEQFAQGTGDGYVIFDADLSKIYVAVAFSATTLRIPRNSGGECVIELTEPGLYTQTNGTVTSVSLSWGGTHTLDEKYIPSTIARKTDLESAGGSGGAFVVNIKMHYTDDGAVATCDADAATIVSHLENGEIALARLYVDEEGTGEYYYAGSTCEVVSNFDTVQIDFPDISSGDWISSTQRAYIRFEIVGSEVTMADGPAIMNRLYISGYGLYLYSSDTYSKKLFRITVNDTGTLTATEVTT